MRCKPTTFFLFLSLAACGRTDVEGQGTGPMATDSGGGGTGGTFGASSGASSMSSGGSTSTSTTIGGSTGGTGGGNCFPLPDDLACLRGWNCIEGCDDFEVDYDLTLSCADACADLYGGQAEDPDRATALLKLWLGSVDEACDGNRLCLSQGLHPTMGAGAYISTCLRS